MGQTPTEFVRARRERAERVVLGIVLQLDTLPKVSWGAGHDAVTLRPIVARVRVRQVWRGSLTDTMTVMVTTVDSRSSCDLELRPGTTYLIFAARTEGGPLATGRCSGTEEERAAAAALTALGPGLIAPTAAPSGLLRAQTPIAIRAADGGIVSADIYGTGDRGIVLVHGGRFDRASWKEQAEELAAARFRVVAIDLRAAVEARAGRETPCLYDETCLAKDVLAAVRYLRETGAKHVSIVGASLGGGAAAQASVDAPTGDIDRVVLLAHMPIGTPEKIQGRKLFIVARHDTRSGDVLRLPEIRAQFKRAADPKELLILDGSAHAQFIFETDEGKRLMREILRFLREP